MSRKLVINQNNVGDRLLWVRGKLGLTMEMVGLGSGIPKASYANLESNHRTAFYEQLHRLTEFLNAKWQERFSTFSDYPTYKGDYLTEITILWVMFGDDYLQKHYKSKLADMQEHFNHRKHQLMLEIESLQFEIRELKDELRDSISKSSKG